MTFNKISLGQNLLLLRLNLITSLKDTPLAAANMIYHAGRATEGIAQRKEYRTSVCLEISLLKCHR